jgi:hypothetical protein
LQAQVRERVEESLKRQGIGSELTKFQKAAVAYHILEANKLIGLNTREIVYSV